MPHWVGDCRVRDIHMNHSVRDVLMSQELTHRRWIVGFVDVLMNQWVWIVAFVMFWCRTNSHTADESLGSWTCWWINEYKSLRSWCFDVARTHTPQMNRWVMNVLMNQWVWIVAFVMFRCRTNSHTADESLGYGCIDESMSMNHSVRDVSMSHELTHRR